MFVSCSVEELKRRVIQQDRSIVGKINSVEALERQLDKKHHQVIPDTDSLIIDNTDLAPEDAAQLIMAHYQFEKSED